MTWSITQLALKDDMEPQIDRNNRLRIYNVFAQYQSHANSELRFEISCFDRVFVFSLLAFTMFFRREQVPPHVATKNYK